MTNVYSGFTKNRRKENINEEIEKINKKFAKINEEFAEINEDFITEQADNWINEKENNKKVNDNFTKIQAWLGRLGGYLYIELVKRGWPNVPQNMATVPSLYVE